MKIGDIVKSKSSGTMGTVEYSSFGFSIHFLSEDNILGKTLGDSKEEILKYWEIIDLPEGYEVCSYGEVRKIG